MAKKLAKQGWRYVISAIRLAWKRREERREDYEFDRDADAAEQMMAQQKNGET